MPAYIDHISARKKISPMGLIWGGPGAPFRKDMGLIFYYCFRLLQMTPNDLFLKDMVVGGILFKIKRCSLDPNT